MHWPSAAPGAVVPVGERRRARRSGPAAAVLHPGARRRAAVPEDRAPSNARLGRPGDRVLDRAGGAVPAAVGGAGLLAHDHRSDQASEVEPHRPDARRSVQIVARHPAGGHLRACEYPPDGTMDAVPPSRVRQSVHAEMPRRRERLPRCVDSLRIRLVTRKSVPAGYAAGRQSADHRSVRNRPHQRTLPTAATPDGTKFAGGPRRSEVPESSRHAPLVSDSAWSRIPKVSVAARM